MSVTATAGVETRPDSARYTVKQAKDPEAHSRAMTGWDHNYQQVDRTPFRASLTELLMGPLQIATEQVGTPFAYRGGIRRGFVSFVSTVPTRGNMVCGGRSLFADAVFGFPRNHTHSAFGNGPVEFVSVSIAQDVLEECMSPLFEDGVPQGMLDSTLCVVEPHVVDGFRRCALGVLTEAESTLFSDERWCADARERVLQVLYDVMAHARTGLRKLPPPSTRAYIVDRAVEYMHAHPDDPQAIRQVCQAVRVCPRTLRYSFEDIIGTSPNRFLQALRLQRVRRELSVAGSIGSIQLIAQRYGFWHMSRFARFYQQAFGELPSATCRRAERAPAPGRRGRGVESQTRELN